MAPDLNLSTPTGIRDWPAEAAGTKRIVENKLADLFASWRYEEVITGTIEYEDVIGRGLNDEEKSQLYRFFGREGEAFTLRPDMTTPIARFVASQLAGAPLPIRLFYTGNVFRHEKPQAGRYREFFQAGIELIGTDTGRADAEVIILASEALRTLGVEDFKIGVGQVQLLDLLLEMTCLPDQTKNLLKQSIADKDYVTVNSIIESASLVEEEKELLNSLSLVQSGEEFFERLAGKPLPSPIKIQLERLRDVYDSLAAAGLMDNVFIDLGITRDFEYYTGIVFEVYSPALGFPICGGGRYNNLFGRFGFPCPATGFALGIERILLVLKRVGKLPSSNSKQLLVYGKDFKKLLGAAAGLRSQGFAVEIDLDGKSREELEKYARAAGMELLGVPAEEE